MPRHERGLAGLDDRELEIEPLRVGEAQAAALPRSAHVLAAEPLRPEVERLV
jgi:hypothetical protein